MLSKLSILAGKRILIVDDEIAVTMLLEDFLIEWECIVAGVCHSVCQALDAVENGVFDLAILDLNLGGQMSHPIAKALDRRGIPFLFLSGYGEQAIPAHPTWPICAKPFSGEELAERLVAVLTSSLLGVPDAIVA